MEKKEFDEIKDLYNALISNNFEKIKLRSFAHDFFLSNKEDLNKKTDLVTESWVNAVLTYLISAGYEIKKK